MRGMLCLFVVHQRRERPLDTGPGAHDAHGNASDAVG